MRRVDGASPRGIAVWAIVVGGALIAAVFRAFLSAQTPAAARPGRTVYDAHCVECHGAAGQGDGPAAHLLLPRPRDFTAGKYKIRTTESGSVPTDDDLLQSVRNGLYDQAERAMAEHGRYLVMTAGCIACHATNGSQATDYSRYLAGGAMKFVSPHGTFVGSNLTPDNETGLARRSDEEVRRVLRSGVFPDGHVAPSTVMPWAAFSNWTEEDQRAVVVYLRHLPAVRHAIPELDRAAVLRGEPGAVQKAYVGKDYGDR